MHPGLEPGLRHSHTLRVDASLIVPALSGTFASFADMPPALATAFMIACIECCALDAVAPFLAAGERTVGTQVDVSHLAATPAGMSITASVEMIAVEGRRLRFRVQCRDERELIGEGWHERAVIDGVKFAARLAQKAERPGR